MDPQLYTWRAAAIMFSLFGVLAIIVASVGLFSVVAYLVEQRRHELGVRLALGARAKDVILLVLRGAIVVTAAGVVIGLAATFVGGRFAEPLLFETSARDPLVLGGVATLLMGVAVIASGIPAARAARVDVLTVLADD